MTHSALSHLHPAAACRWLAAACGLWLISATLSAADAPATSVIKDGARVAIVGDSITEQKQYSRFIEVYLTACQPQLHTQCMQFGWSGERAPGFAARMDNDLLPYQPTVVTLCYGMNDGGYGAYRDDIGKTYDTSMRDIIARCMKAGATVIVGTPGPVDSVSFRKDPAQAKVYNETLAKLGELGEKAAADAKQPFANLHAPMMASMAAAKAANGPDYVVCGGDGVHPGPNGHLLMAQAFLKAMGLDGDLGTITVDLKGASTAVNGHKVLSSQDGKVELESSRLPFCFFGGEKDANGTISILPFTSFNQDLNRLTLVVKNLGKPAAAITWGKTTKEFDAAALEKGINLAAEFAAENPLQDAFRKLDGTVGAKQNMETVMIKSSITSMPAVLNTLDQAPAAAAALNDLRKAWWAKHEKLQAAVQAAMVPVKHTLVVLPLAAGEHAPAPAPAAPAAAPAPAPAK